MTFQKTGLHIDLRIQVPPMSALRRIARQVADAGHNVLLIEWEASFPFAQHGIISHHRAYQRCEVANFICECSDHGLEVIPLQQCFGHIEYILRHPRYASLRECDHDLDQLCPSKADAAWNAFSGIFSEMIEMHPSSLIHIGGDETRLLGYCNTCRQRVAEEGISALYVGYLQRVALEIIKLGKRPMLWMDMLLKYPEAATKMPRECIFVDWNYGWPADHLGKLSNLESLPFEFWGAGTLRAQQDNHSIYSWRGHFENIRNYLPEARKRGFTGIIWTSWSKSGRGTFEWEDVGRPQNYFPMRRRMPHVGLPIYVAAFSAAVQQDTPLDYEEFIKYYASQQFGFSRVDADHFMKALLSAEPMDDVTFSKESHQHSKEIVQVMNRLRCKVQKHALEFQRYHLMLKLSENYHRFRLLEAEAQILDFSHTRQRKNLANRLRTLHRQSHVLSSEFCALYQGELYPDEIVEEITYRMGNLLDLERRINRRFT